MIELVGPEVPLRGLSRAGFEVPLTDLGQCITQWGWQLWVEPVLGAPYPWRASFSPSVPHDLVAALASLFASPVPVPRRTWPGGADGRHRTVRRS
ncbi:DUF317 domain-containing protein [Streptomyces olivaceus]|nr:DUF317 domain-containing protein [Streptomyces olivaceus]